MTKTQKLELLKWVLIIKKEIEFLCNIAKPDFGYITNFGKAHLEGFGGIEGVIEGKSEMYNYLIGTKGLVFYNLDDSIQAKKMNSYNKTFSFSSTTKSQVTIKLKEANPIVKLDYDNITITSNLIGSYNFTNLSAAVAIGHYFKIKNNEIKSALENYIPQNNRSQIIEKDNNTIILDAYNANPTSMTAALNNLSQLSSSNKLAIIGDMFELGKTSLLEHQNILDFALSLDINTLILVGENFHTTTTTSLKIKKYKTFEELKENFKLTDSPHQILIKGSRGMALERVLNLL